MARSKGTGSIYMRPNGTYVGTIIKNGVKKSCCSKDKKEVERKLLEFSKQHEFEKANSVKFSAYVYDYLYTYKYRHIKDSSFDRLESVYRNHILNSSIGDMPMHKLNDVVIQKYINDKVASDLSLSSAKKIFELVRTILFYAYRKKDIAVDYGSLIRLPNANSFKEVKHIDTYTDGECEKICDYIFDSYYSNNKERRFLRYAPAFVIMLHTGLRAGEMLALTWDHVDLDNRKIYINTSVSLVKDRSNEAVTKYVSVISTVKTSASKRSVPLNDMAVKCFRELKSRYADYGCLCDYVVCNMKDDYVKLRSFETKFEKICVKLNIPYKGVHALRHTFASNLIARGVSPKTVSKLLGHTNVVFTLNRYVHPDDGQMQNAVDLL